jgi:predicted PurR-regulated permease PerM
MKHVTGLNPVVTLTCLLVGFKLWGAGGAILSIPAFLVIKTVVTQTYLARRQSSKK